MHDVYERLRKKMDDLGTGFPATDSGVELKILKWLFTEEEADLFTKLTPLLETAEEVAGRTGSEVERIAALMEKMAEKGLLLRYQKGEISKFGPMPYVAGIFDLQVNKMDAELALNMDEYFDTALGPTPQSFKTPLFRSIPVQRQLARKPETDLYEPPKTIAETYKRLAMERGKI